MALLRNCGGTDCPVRASPRAGSGGVRVRKPRELRRTEGDAETGRPPYRMKNRLPRMRLVALSTASAAPRGASFSVR